MTKEHQARPIAQLEHELKSFEAEVHAARSENERRHSLDRVRQTADALARVRAGGKG